MSFSAPTSMIIKCFILFGVLSFFGCMPPTSFNNDTNTTLRKIASSSEPKVSVFLNLNNPRGGGETFSISLIEILSLDVWIPIFEGSYDCHANSIENDQVLLSRTMVPVGRYGTLRLTLRDIEDNSLNSSKTFVKEYPISLDMNENDSKALFLVWDIERSLREAAQLEPVLFPVIPLIPLQKELIYITCPEINTVYVIRTDNNRVCGSFGISGSPLSPVFRDNKLYILSSQESLIKVIDVTTWNKIDSIHLPMARAPHFMALSPDGKQAYVLDNNTNYVMKIDLESGSIASYLRLDGSPNYAYYIKNNNLLAVATSSEVYLLDATTLKKITSIQAGRKTSGLLEVGDDLYIAEKSTGTVIIYDLIANAITNQIRVGFSPERLLYNGTYIYVTNHDSRSVSLIKPGHVNIVKEIYIGDKITEMVWAEARKWLYLTDIDLPGITVVDTTTSRLVKHITLDALPNGLTIMP